MCIAFGVSVITIVVIFVQIFEEQVASLFTSDPDDIYYINSVLQILGVYLIAESVHGVQSGNVRGLGKQGIASVITIICYYCFGLPMAMYLGFTKGYELVGFWGGMLIAIVALDLAIIYLVVKSDWTKEAVDRKLMEKSSSEKILDDDHYLTANSSQRKDTIIET